MDELGALLGESFENNSTPQIPSLPSLNLISSIFKLPVDRGQSSPFILNFANQNPCEENIHQLTDMASKPAKSSKRIRTRSPSQVYEHIMAERRRRDQLSRLFIALSAIIPGLKKADKNSILIDAIKHLTHLQQGATTLKELAMESTVIVKKSKLFVEDEGSSDEKTGSSDDLSPEIEARVINNNILIRVHCGKQKGILANLLSKVESLDMVVVNTNVTPFGRCALDITIIAEMEKDFNMSVREVAMSLRRVLQAVDV